MIDYKRVETSAEVWAAIRARHPEMIVFGSYSAPDGEEFGDPSRGRKWISYGFEGCDVPVIEAQTTWDVNRVTPYKVENKRNEYWLCLPNREDATN